MTDLEYQAALDQCHLNRRVSYPTIGDQLDAIYKRDHLGDPGPWDAVAASIAAVKIQYPKPTPPEGPQ